VCDRLPRDRQTHVATGLGILTAELAHRLFFLSGLARLGAAFRENQPPHAMKMLTQPRPLIVDEVGYLGSARRELQCSSRSTATGTKNAATISLRPAIQLQTGWRTTRREFSTFDFRVHSCHSKCIKRRLLVSDSRPQPRGLKLSPISKSVSVLRSIPL
jgi:hypothetical protein